MNASEWVSTRVESVRANEEVVESSGVADKKEGRPTIIVGSDLQQPTEFLKSA